MEFLDLQEDLEGFTLDNSTDYAAGGTMNKKCINKAYEHIYDSVKNSTRANRHFKKPKTEITVANKIANLPADFDTIGTVSIFDFDTDSDIDGISDGRVYEFEIRGKRGEKKMYLEELGFSKLYITYIPVREDLDLDTDVPLLPEELHPNITDFALYYYHRFQRDLPAASDSLNLAQAVLNERLETL